MIGKDQKGIDMGKLYDDLTEGLQECLAYEQDKIALRSEFIEIPKSPEEYTAKGYPGV